MKKTKKIKSKSIKRKTSKKSLKYIPIWEPKFNQMKNKIQKAFFKLEKDIAKKAPMNVIEKANNNLLLLLGECNYLVREFHEYATLKAKKIKKYL